MALIFLSDNFATVTFLDERAGALNSTAAPIGVKTWQAFFLMPRLGAGLAGELLCEVNSKTRLSIMSTTIIAAASSFKPREHFKTEAEQ